MKIEARHVVVFSTLFLVLVIVIGGRGLCSMDRSSTPARPALTEDLRAKVQMLWDTGMLKRFDEEWGKAYVSPPMWSMANVNLKQNVTYVLSQYLEAKGHGGKVEVYDFQTGLKVASYDAWKGWKAY